jgi:transcriptional regulator with XRE-family HTH domain
MKRQREQLGLNRKEFAEMLGVHPSLITKVEKGYRPISVHLAKKLEEATKVSVEAWRS